MPYADNMIDAPLNINEGGGDIGTALGTTVADIGCLCTDRNTSSDSAGAYPRIDKWARYKPVNLSAIGFVTEAQRRSVNFGLSATQETGPALAAARGWTYTRPTSRYRFYDWVKVSDAGVPVVDATTGRGIGYVDLGVAPCRGFYMATTGNPTQLTTYQYYSTQQVQNDINFEVITTGSDYGIGLAEMGDLSTWYMCIAVDVIKNGVITPYMVTSSQAIGAGTSGQTTWQTVQIPTNNSVMGGEATYSAYAVICNKVQTTWDLVSNDASRRFLPLPLADATIAEFQFHVNATTYSIWCQYASRQTYGSTAQQRLVSFTLYGKNTAQNSITVQRTLVELVYAESPEDVWTSTTILGNAQDYINATAITIPGDTTSGTQLRTGTIGSQQIPGPSNKGKLWIRVTGSYNGATLFSSFTQVKDVDGTIPDEPLPRD